MFKTKKIINILLLSNVITLPIFLPLVSCSKNWSQQIPITFGSTIIGSQNDPFFYLRDKKFLNKNNKNIVDILPSIYSYTKDKYFQYLSNETKQKWSSIQINKQNNDNSLSANDNDSILKLNLNVLPKIAYDIQSLIDLAFNYQSSFINDQEKINEAWGNNLDLNDKVQKKNFYELVFANSNSHSIGKTSTFFKTTSFNFNFNKDFFPYPSYEFSKGKIVDFSPEFKKVLEGDNDNSSLSQKAKNCHWTEKITKDNNIHLKYFSVPIVIEPLSIFKTYVSSKKNDSNFTSDFYQNDISLINKSIGDTWKKSIMVKNVDKSIYKKGKEYLPTFKAFELKIKKDNKVAKEIKTKIKDNRLNNLTGDKFIALFDYTINLNTKDWAKTNVSMFLSTIFPTYFFDICQDDDLFIKASSNHSESDYIINVNKINALKTKLFNIYNHKDENFNKEFLQFLNYVFSENGKIDPKNFLVGHYSIND